MTDPLSRHGRRPVFLWIHGGYWRALSRADNAFIAGGLVPQGVSVAVMDDTLAPAATLEEITRQVGAALAWAVRRHGGPVHVGGSFAGGRLAAARRSSTKSTGSVSVRPLPMEA